MGVDHQPVYQQIPLGPLDLSFPTSARPAFSSSRGGGENTKKQVWKGRVSDLQSSEIAQKKMVIQENFEDSCLELYNKDVGKSPATS